MTPTREQLAVELLKRIYDWNMLDSAADGSSWRREIAQVVAPIQPPTEGDLKWAAAACLAAPPPEPQAMPPIEPDDWVELEQWPNCEWVVLSVDSDGRVSLIGLDLRYRIRDVIGISKANGTVWTRETRR